MFFYLKKKGDNMRLASLLIIFFTTSCSWSVIMNHSEGGASGIVDENQTASPEVKPDLEVPLKP
jgi:hypothetical protein